MPNLTDMQITQMFADMLNRHDGAFARGELVMCEENIYNIYLDKRMAAQLVFTSQGMLTDIEPMDF
jgi:hypothetical protein